MLSSTRLALTALAAISADAASGNDLAVSSADLAWFATPILTDQSIALSWGSEPRPAPEPHPHAITDTEHTMAHLNEQSYVPPSNRFAERAHREISDAQRHVASVFKDNPDRPGLNPRGYNYLGPGNPMDGRPPTNPGGYPER